jgi:hypothetical protein
MRRPLPLLASFVALAACGSSSSSDGSCSLAPTPGTPSACARAPGSSTARAPVTAIPLGQLQVGRSATFTVPANTASVTIVEQAVSAPDQVTYPSPTGAVDNTAVPFRVYAPNGLLVFDASAAPPTDPAALPATKAFFGASAPGTGTLTIPNTTGGLALVGPAGLPAGDWTVTVSDRAYLCTMSCCSGGSTASAYDVTVVLKGTPDGQTPASGGIDVTVWFATSTAPLPPRTGRPSSDAALSAAKANAGGDSDLLRMQQSLATVLAGAGLGLRSITYQDLPPEVQASYSGVVNVDDTGSCGSLANLFQHSTDGNRLNVFLVGALTSASLPSGQTIVGVDGTVPGPATIAGSMATGVAVGAQDLRANTSLCTGTTPSMSCGADETAFVIAHEAGHYLGLYHTTEGTGTLFDPLGDTPACPCSRCAVASARSSCADASPPPASGHEHQMTTAECSAGASCGGADNLMFYLLNRSVSRPVLTAEQQRVARANPLVQ